MTAAGQRHGHTPPLRMPYEPPKVKVKGYATVAFAGEDVN